MTQFERPANAPLYHSLTQALRRELAEGRYAIGQFMPPMRQIAREYHCSLTTVQQAFRALIDEGLLIADSTRGVRVRAFPATSETMGRIVAVFPKWNSMQEESFAAQFVLGVSLAAAENGFVAEPVPIDETINLDATIERLCKRPPAGVVWANPGHLRFLTQLKAAGVRVVTAIRYLPEVSLPYTFDDMEPAYTAVIDGMRERGVKRLAVLCMGVDDPTYEPYVQLMLRIAGQRGLKVPPELVCRMRTSGLDRHAQQILLSELLRHLKPGDGLYAFAPDTLSSAIDDAKEQGRDLSKECILGVHSIRSMYPPKVSFLLQSDMRMHGEQGVRLVREWLQTNDAPEPRAIPVAFSAH